MSENHGEAAMSELPEEIEDPVIVPRGLLGAAGYAIKHKKDAPQILAELRKFAYGPSFDPPPSPPIKEAAES